MNQKVIEILEKGPNFAFAINKYNKRDDQIGAEYLYNQIDEISKNHSCNGNIKRFFEDFEVLCKSYIGKKQKMAPSKKTQWESIKNFAKKEL